MKNKKRLIIILIAVFLLSFAVCAAIYFMYLPSQYKVMTVSTWCAEIDGSSISEPHHIPSSFTPRDGTNYGLCNSFGGHDLSFSLREVNFAIRSAVYVNTEEKPTDAQIVKIEFTENENTVYSILYAYDFYLNDIFALKDCAWYKVRFPFFLNNVLNEYCRDALGTMADYWKGQSTLCYNEYSCDHISNLTSDMLTFRYNLYWKSELPVSENISITQEHDISNSDQAIELSAAEMGYSEYSAIALYDKTCGYWMVEIVNSEGFSGEYNSENLLYLFENVYTVIIDNEGKIIQKYQFVTSSKPFLKIAE